MTAKRFGWRTGLPLLLAGAILMSMTACRPEEADTPSEESSQAAESASVPELPDNKTLVTNPGTADFVIAENGTAKAVIVIPESPSDKVKAAAEDLQTYLNRMTGGSIPIVDDSEDHADENGILVGPTKQTAAMGIQQPTGYPDAEKVILKRVGNRVAVLGNDDERYQGTAFAVTMLLERMGCGWFGIDELWEVVPSYPTVAIGELDVEHVPQFNCRWTYLLSKNPEMGQRWYQGGDNKMVGHGITGLIPRKTYMETHPEWFALVDGVRDPQSQAWWQYDYTNEELAAETAKKVLEKLEADPTLTNYSLAANDGWEKGWCECETCAAAGNPTDQILTFANRVAEIVCKTRPDVTISILSYHNNYFPPEKVKAHPNVEVMFCREASMTKPLDLNEAVIGKNSITHNIYTQSWLGNFKEFIAKAEVQHISIWEWNCIAADKVVWADIPWVQGNVATRNQALWKQNGVDYVYYDQGPWPSYNDTEESYPLRWPLWYVSAKGMWDGSLSGEQILYDACRKLYGAAADEMFAYYKALADSSEQCQADSICWVPPSPSELYTDARVAVIEQTVEAAKAKLDGVTPEQRQRMENQFSLWKKASFLIKYN